MSMTEHSFFFPLSFPVILVSRTTDDLYTPCRPIVHLFARSQDSAASIRFSHLFVVAHLMAEHRVVYYTSRFIADSADPPAISPNSQRMTGSRRSCVSNSALKLCRGGTVDASGSYTFDDYQLTREACQMDLNPVVGVYNWIYLDHYVVRQGTWFQKTGTAFTEMCSVCIVSIVSKMLA